MSPHGRCRLKGQHLTLPFMCTSDERFQPRRSRKQWLLLLKIVIKSRQSQDSRSVPGDHVFYRVHSVKNQDCPGKIEISSHVMLNCLLKIDYRPFDIHELHLDYPRNASYIQNYKNNTHQRSFYMRVFSFRDFAPGSRREAPLGTTVP